MKAITRVLPYRIGADIDFCEVQKQVNCSDRMKSEKLCSAKLSRALSAVNVSPNLTFI